MHRGHRLSCVHVMCISTDQHGTSTQRPLPHMRCHVACLLSVEASLIFACPKMPPCGATLLTFLMHVILVCRLSINAFTSNEVCVNSSLQRVYIFTAIPSPCLFSCCTIPTHAWLAVHTQVNNAGAAARGAVLDVPIDATKELFETNFYGQIRMIQAVSGTTCSLHEH